MLFHCIFHYCLIVCGRVKQLILACYFSSQVATPGCRLEMFAFLCSGTGVTLIKSQRFLPRPTGDLRSFIDFLSYFKYLHSSKAGNWLVVAEPGPLDIAEQERSPSARYKTPKETTNRRGIP
ncbi:hypothetical protein Pelo_17422 [Pelomyxa schiedti]|nr:hypothetical protein Pelo_17422 [Pelomyxa schiedti]